MKKTCTKCAFESPTNAKYCIRCGHELPKVEQVPKPDPELPQSPANKRKVKTFVGLAFGIIAFALAYYGVQQFLQSEPVYEKAMMKVASELNKSCPIMVDADTRLDNTIALPDNVFQYNYTLVNMSREDINVDEMKEAIEPTIVNLVKTNPQMEFQRQHKTTLNYAYKDKIGQHLFTISVTPEQYQ